MKRTMQSERILTILEVSLMAILLEPKLERIGECLMVCDCGWEGTVYECEGGFGDLLCPECENIAHEKAQQFELIFRRISNQGIQVLLNGMFLMQCQHESTWPLEIEIAHCLRIAAEIVENISLQGKMAAQISEEYAETLRRTYGHNSRETKDVEWHASFGKKGRS